MAEEIVEIDEISKCLADRQSFLLSGGAGSGKTHTLIQTIDKVFTINPLSSVACITYTNVASDEIKSRTPYKELHVSTIHDFLWFVLKNFKKPLKTSLFALLDAEKEVEGSGIKYSGETELNQDNFETVEYRNYRKLENGIISHDDLIKIAHYMFSHFPLLSIIVCDKFDFIFVDEYQDTDKKVIEIILDNINEFSTKKNPCFGFFGDRMQSIYDNGIGNIQKYVDSGIVKEIVKNDNYRCSKKVIELINKLRDDKIIQKPSKADEKGIILNKEGRISFVYSMNNDFDSETLKNYEIFSDWNFDDSKNTKMLFLTHKLIAVKYGFADLLEAYRQHHYPDNLTGNEPDVFASHLLKIGETIYHFDNKNYNSLIKIIQFKITRHQKKSELSNILKNISIHSKKTIKDTIDEFDKCNILKKDDRLTEYASGHPELVDAVNNLPFSQLKAYYEYYNNLSPYSTQHGVKGAEYDNVIVILDNGRWNKYNVSYFFEKKAGKESIIERTQKLFYVCCSRAKNNLVVYVNNPSTEFIKQAKIMFGNENVHEI